MLEDLLNILFPTRCVLCKKFPKPLCDACWLSLEITPRAVHRGALSGLSLFDYSDQIKTLIIEFKDRGAVAIGKRLTLLAASVLAKPDCDLIAVAPSSPVNFGRRGFSPAKVIGLILAKQWRVGVTEVRRLARVRDQVGLSPSERRSNLTDTMLSPLVVAAKKVLLVDDIVTTGATLTELARAITDAGGRVVGFVTLAETIRKTPTKNPKKV